MRVRRALDQTKKLTSGPAFKKGCVGLHHDIFHEHLVDYNNGKKMEQLSKKKRLKQVLHKRKQMINIICEKSIDKWTVNDIHKLLTYKKKKDDPALKTATGDRMTLLLWWNERKNRPSPCCSPLSSDDKHEL
jgi:hypothetical protein